MASAEKMFIGCAGWSLPRGVWPAFPPEGSHLERYAARFNAVEINSSFYKPHQRTTYERWADSVPAPFRFVVKLPKTITHAQRLVGCEGLLDDFLAQAGGLGNKLGCLLVQLPPSLAFDAAQAGTFLQALRSRHGGAVALEPRHASWFTDAADALMRQRHISRVLADPVLFEPGRAPGGDPATVYVRLHGSPRMYYSAYERGLLDALAARLNQAAPSATCWCLFDNTAAGAAVDDALYLRKTTAKTDQTDQPGRVNSHPGVRQALGLKRLVDRGTRQHPAQIRTEVRPVTGRR